MKDIQVPLALDTLNEGNLNRDFKAMIPRLVQDVMEIGGKAVITIRIDLAKVKDTSSIVTTSYRISQKPPVKEHAGVCTMTSNFGLKTDPAWLNLFEKEEKEA